MRTWLYHVDRPLGLAEARSQPIDKTCLVCGSKLLRLAERESHHPYSWRVCGWICAGCNTVYVVNSK